jgi:NAD-dependent SIR2 family protein deacetylase
MYYAPRESSLVPGGGLSSGTMPVKHTTRRRRRRKRYETRHVTTSSLVPMVPLRRTEVARGSLDFHDAPSEQSRKAQQLAERMARARRTVVLTGAGVSTASGLRDRSSGMDCSAAVRAGPGTAALRSELSSIARLAANCNGQVSAIARKRQGLAVRLAGAQRTVGGAARALPSKCHMDLVALYRHGRVHHIISTNTDGLHWRSGVPPEALTTLQGNPYIEACGDCGHQYLRDFMVRDPRHLPKQVRDRPRGSHFNGRFCTRPECQGLMQGGRLFDNLVLPGEAIDPQTMRRALDQIDNCDVLIIMGSSLREEPSLVCMREALLRRRNHPPFVALVGLQRTKHDASVHLKMHGSCNELTARLRRELDAGKRTLDFRVRLRVHVGVIFRPDDSDEAEALIAEGKMVDGAELPPHPNGEIYVRVEEQNGLPLTCINSLMVTLPSEYTYYGTDYMSSCVNTKTLRGETWNGRVSCTIDPMTFPGWAQICVRLRQAGPVGTAMERHPVYFQHYLDNTRESDVRTAYVLEFDPAAGAWADAPLSVVQTGAPGADNRGYGGMSYGRIGTAESTRPYSSIGSTGSSSREGSALASAGRGGGGGGTRGSMVFTPGSSGRPDSSMFPSTDMRPGTSGYFDVPTSAGRSGFMDGNSQFSLPDMSASPSRPASRATMVDGGISSVGVVAPLGSDLGGAGSDTPSTAGSRGGGMGGIRRSSLSRNEIQRPMSMQQLTSSSSSAKPMRKRPSVSFAPAPAGRSKSVANLDASVSFASSWGSGDVPLTTSQTELLRRLAEPSMITGSDMPKDRVTLTGGEKEQRPMSESMQMRTRQKRIEMLLDGKKVSKERRHSIVDGDRSRVKMQGYRRLPTAVPMTPPPSKQDKDMMRLALSSPDVVSGALSGGSGGSAPALDRSSLSRGGGLSDALAHHHSHGTSGAQQPPAMTWGGGASVSHNYAGYSSK